MEAFVTELLSMLPWATVGFFSGFLYGRWVRERHKDDHDSRQGA